MSNDQNPAPAGEFSKEDVDNGKICAILAYIIPIVGIIWYFVDEKMKKNPFTTYHMKQALVLLIVWIAISVLTCGTLSIVGLIFAILGIINAANGEKKELPVIGAWGEQWFKF